MKLRMLDALTVVAAVVTVVGALFWGAKGVLGIDVVRRVAGRQLRAERALYGVVGLAGLWMVFQLVAPMLAIAVSRRPRSRIVERRWLVGERMPSIEGRTLSGKRLTLPEAAGGRTALVVVGFSYDSRWDVESWVDAFSERYGERPGLTFFEVPVIGGLVRLAAPAIDAGMRAGTPDDLYDNVVTVYGPAETIRRQLGAGADSDAWVYLVGGDGTVLFQAEGAWDEAKFNQLASAVESAPAIGEREVKG